MNFKAVIMFSVLAFMPVGISTAQSSDDQVADQSSFAQPRGSFSYRKIASSYHPAVLMGDWRCRIGSEAQLLVDDYLIFQRQGLKRSMHQPTKYSGNPVLKAEAPCEVNPSGSQWGGIVCANGTIIQDPMTGQWRMYYGGAMRRRCLALSDDLIHWRRPILNLVEFEGSKANNIVFDDMNSDTISVLYDESEADPAKKWKAALYHYHQGNERPEGVYAYFSPDGIHWTMLDEPIMNSWTHAPDWRDQQKWSQAWPMPGIGDVNALSWDDRLKTFVAHVKLATYRDGKYFRSRGMCESDDFIHWSEPRITILPDADDPEDLQLYGSTGWPYESLWLGTLRAYHETAGNVDFQLISSRDGRHWSRAGDRQSFIPNGPEGSYDQGYHTEFTNPPIPVGDELWFFYGSTTTTGKNEKTKWVGTINLATLRRDGFVSLDAGPNEGWLVTRPLLFEGGRMIINADAAHGEIRVEVLEFEFAKPPSPPLKTIDGFEKENCRLITGNGLEMPVKWNNHQDLSSLAGRHVRLRFYLKNANLYSFTIK